MSSSPRIFLTKHRRVFFFNLTIILFMVMSCSSFREFTRQDVDNFDQGGPRTPTPVDIAETEIPYDGLVTMRLVFDTGCDEKYNGGYTSYSRVNLIPVEIGKIYVTVNYDKASTSGEKHFVAEGTGKVGDKGIITINYTMSFTRKLSCDGIPCEGIESGSGNYTGIWNPETGIWKGEATGTVNVDFPNTLGDLGDNSIKCSASIIKSVITPGFNDPDL